MNRLDAELRADLETRRLTPSTALLSSMSSASCSPEEPLPTYDACEGLAGPCAPVPASLRRRAPSRPARGAVAAIGRVSRALALAVRDCVFHAGKWRLSKEAGETMWGIVGLLAIVLLAYSCATGARSISDDMHRKIESGDRSL